MLSFHQRSRSLISIATLEKGEKHNNALPTEDGFVELEEDEPQTPRQKRNLTMIYVLFLAEAIMSASLSSQIAVLVPSDTSCLSMDTAYLRSILSCAYYFGSAAGLFWGRAVDKFGRRRVALIGLAGMSTCCISMGFATSFLAFALLRFIAGAVGAATSIAGLAMLADVTHASKSRTKVVSRLPMVVVCGSIGPLVAHMWHKAFDGSRFAVFAAFPSLPAQIACSGLVLSLAAAEAWLLEETLPSLAGREEDRDADDVDCEKAAFLGQSLSNDSDDSLNITIMEALRDDRSAPLPSSISISQLLTAPTFMLLLTSYSILELHSSTFEILLPHIGHTAANSGGMGIPCSWLQPITTVVAVFAALRVSRLVPWIVSRVGLLTMYRKTSIAFPILYALVPLVGLAVNTIGGPPVIAAVFSTVVMYFKTALAEAARVLVLLLVMSAAPDAFSTGAVLGIVSISELTRALAVGISGISYYLSDSQSVIIVNASLWAALVVAALIGSVTTLKLRETPRVGSDIPEECLAWEGVFDSESDDGY